MKRDVLTDARELIEGRPLMAAIDNASAQKIWNTVSEAESMITDASLLMDGMKDDLPKSAKALHDLWTHVSASIKQFHSVFKAELNTVLGPK